jgi:hypothetical protein
VPQMARHQNVRHPSDDVAARGARVVVGRIAIALALVVMLLGAVSDPARAVDSLALDTARAVPAEAQFYFVVEADRTSAQMQQLETLLTRLGAADVDDFAAALSDVGVAVDDEQVNDLLELADGELAVAGYGIDFEALANTDDLAVQDPASLSVDDVQSAAPQGIVALITASDMAATSAEIERQIQESALDDGAIVREETIEGVRVLISSDGMGDDGESVVAFAENVIIFGTTIEDVQPFIGTSQGTMPSLAEAADFQEAMGHLPADVLVAGYAPMLTDNEDLESMLAEEGIGFAFDLVSEQGRASAFSLSAEDAGIKFDTVQLPAAGSSFESSGSASAMTFTSQVPDDVWIIVNGFDLGSSTVFRLVEQVLIVALEASSGSADPLATPVPVTQDYLDEQYESLSLLFGFNPQTDFIRQLEGEYGFALHAIDPADPASTGAILVSDVLDPITVENALESLNAVIQSATQGQFPVTTTTIGGGQVSQVDIPVDDFQQVTLQWGILEGQFVLGLGNALAEYVLGVPSPLSESVTFQETMSYLPAEYDGVFYLQLSRLTDLAESMATESFSDFDGGGEDASESCAVFVDQAEAQAAYDEDPVANYDLDQNFDGVACEDFFSGEDMIDDIETGASVDVTLGDFAMVSYKQDGLAMTSGILIIPEQE